VFDNDGDTSQRNNRPNCGGYSPGKLRLQSIFKLVSLLFSAYFNSITTVTNGPVVLGFVSVVLAICPNFVIRIA